MAAAAYLRKSGIPRLTQSEAETVEAQIEREIAKAAPRRTFRALLSSRPENGRKNPPAPFGTGGRTSGQKVDCAVSRAFACRVVRYRASEGSPAQLPSVSSRRAL